MNLGMGPAYNYGYMAKFNKDLFALTTGELKEALKKARNNEPVEEEPLNFIGNDGRPSALHYSIEYGWNDDKYLVIYLGPEPQKILLHERPLTYGVRTEFVCGCGRKCNTLYLSADYFSCRKCKLLRYESTRVNKNSDHAYMRWIYGKRMELMEMKASIKRIFYKGQYTKKYLRYISLCIKYHAYDEVEASKEVTELLRDFREKYPSEFR